MSGDAAIPRFEALDSLRGLCACIVVLFHIGSSGFIAWLPFIDEGGWMFVDFFFVLSGFVISASYGAKLANGFPMGRFMFLRFGRIYPLHLAILGLFVAMELAAMAIPSLSSRPPFTDPRSPQDLAATMALLQTFNITHSLGWNSPSWSIAAEFWTYALFAVLVTTLTGRTRQWAIGLLIVGSLAWLASTEKNLSHDDDFGIIRCIFGFFLGTASYALYTAYQSGLRERLGSMGATVCEVVLVGLSVWLLSVAGEGPLTLLAPPLFLVAVALFALEGGMVSRLLIARPMRFLGLLSYSIYMVHVFVLGRVLDVVRKIRPDYVDVMPNGTKAIVVEGLVANGLIVAILIAVIVASSVTYYLVEKPGRDWSRRMAARYWSPKSVPA